MVDAVVLAGATGDLGGRIAVALIARGVKVRAIVRPGTAAERTAALAATGARLVVVDLADRPALTAACRGAVCVVSALSGLAPVIVDAQTVLLEAAVAGGVPRFVPSDYSLDYTTLPEGSNRNFDLRRRFRERLARMPIRATSIFNGAFADMLAGQMPLIVRPLRRVAYIGDPDRRFALTTKDDTAAFTAAVALDPAPPRDLHVAGSSVSSRELATIMTAITGRRWGLLPGPSLRGLERLIRVVRRLAPRPDEVFPPWQGMQYLHGMFSGLATADPTDNDRYPDMHWTRVAAVLADADGERGRPAPVDGTSARS